MSVKMVAISTSAALNWDDEVETEEAGTFSQADESTLKGRVIKKAKRRGLANQVKCLLIAKSSNKTELKAL